MLKLGILVSGGGTNLQAILDAIEEKKITNAEAAVVISNNAGAYALERARKKVFRQYVFLRKTMRQEKSFTGRFWTNCRKIRWAL